MISAILFSALKIAHIGGEKLRPSNENFPLQIVNCVELKYSVTIL